MARWFGLHAHRPSTTSTFDDLTGHIPSRHGPACAPSSRTAPAATTPTTLTGLTVQIDQLRRSLEAAVAKARRHEEHIRRLERARRIPG